MPKNLTQGTIDFTVNTTESVGGFATKRTNSALLASGKYSVSTKQALIDSGYEYQGGFSINAVEIDWNGAKPGIGEGANGITTTGELKKGVYSPMFAKAA